MILIEEHCFDDIEISHSEKGWDQDGCIVIDQSGDQIFIQNKNVPELIEALKKLLR
jgi:hypothetical protein